MDEKIFKFAYNMAFRDSTMRNAFIKKEGETDEEFQIRKSIIKEKAFLYVKNYIEDIFNEKKPDPLQPINNISIKCSNEQYRFGNAQKLVNMTAKYMYISVLNTPSDSEKFSNCHCPMDSSMRDKVSSLNEKFKKQYGSVSWSRLELKNGKIPAAYTEFQKIINENCNNSEEISNPIEFDYYYFE